MACRVTIRTGGRSLTSWSTRSNFADIVVIDKISDRTRQRGSARKSARWRRISARFLLQPSSIPLSSMKQKLPRTRCGTKNCTTRAPMFQRQRNTGLELCLSHKASLRSGTVSRISGRALAGGNPCQGPLLACQAPASRGSNVGCRGATALRTHGALVGGRSPARLAGPSAVSSASVLRWTTVWPARIRGTGRSRRSVSSLVACRRSCNVCDTNSLMRDSRPAPVYLAASR